MPTNLLMFEGDIYIAPDGVTRWTTDLATETAQRLQSKYNLWLGEWFLDLREGVPYYREVLGRNRNMSVVRNVLRRVAVEDPAVDSVPTFDVSLDADRHLLVSFTAILINGQVIELSPFIV